MDWLHLDETLNSIISNWLDENALEKFRENGYYSMMVPNSNLKIISLNTNFCAELNSYFFVRIYVSTSLMHLIADFCMLILKIWEDS